MSYHPLPNQGADIGNPLPQELARLIVEVADRAYLTTMADDGYPRTRAVLNLRNPSLYPDQVDLFDRHR